jgi:hypothetical protein
VNNDLIPLGITIAIEPLPVIGFILVLSTDRGVRNGAAFLTAWVACIVAILAATAALTGGKPVSTSSLPATLTYWAEIIVGLGLVGLAIERRLHPRPEPPPAPGWASRLDNMHAAGAAVLGVLLQPWPLVGAAAADVLAADLSKAQAVAQLVAFTVLASSSLLIMEIWVATSPERARARLEALRHWLEGHRNQAITLLAAVVGLWLLVKGGYGLISQS